MSESAITVPTKRKTFAVELTEEEWQEQNRENSQFLAGQEACLKRKSSF